MGAVVQAVSIALHQIAENKSSLLVMEEIENRMAKV